MAAAEQRIAAPVDQVFALLRDASRWEEWFTLHGGWPDGPPEVVTGGCSYRQRVAVHGQADTVRWLVERCAEPTVLVVAGKGTFGGGARLAFALRGADGVTDIRADVTALVRAPGPLKRRLEEPLATELARSLGRLEALICAAGMR